MREPFAIAGITAAPGAIAKGWWKVSELYDGSPVQIPVAVINGAEDGQVLWVQNAVHGDEPVGIEGIHRLLRSARPAEMKGAVVLIPWVNVQAFRAGVRGAPQDGMDMNRVYPGKPLERAMHINGHTEIVVHQLMAEIKRVASVVLDLHDGGFMGKMVPYIQYFVTDNEVDARTRAIAMASGMDVVWESPAGFVDDKAPQSIGTVTSPMGIPTLTMESGGEGKLEEPHITRMHLGLMNILKYLQIVPGEPEPHGWQQKLFVRQGHWLRPKRGGVYVGLRQPGERVLKGDVVSEVRDAFGETVERILAPADGVVIGMRTLGTIATGQYAGNVSEVVPSLG